MFELCFDKCTEGNLNELKFCYNNPIGSDMIVNLDLKLNYGPINGDIFKAQAMREIDIYKSFFKNVSENECNSCYKEKLHSINSAILKINKQLKTHGILRLWISNNAFDRCALYWFCNYMKDYDCKINVVMCPGVEISANKNKLTENTRWAAFDNLPYMASFAKNVRELTKQELELYSNLWQELVEKNAPLRVLIDNKIISTTDDFFDNVILSCIAETPQSQATIINRFLGKWYCADFCFVSQRIEYLIEKGKIKIVEDKVNDDGNYIVRTICRVESQRNI